MAHEKLIAKLRNRATVYAPQSQMEIMLEAAAVIEEQDRTIATQAVEAVSKMETTTTSPMRGGVGCETD